MLKMLAAMHKRTGTPMIKPSCSCMEADVLLGSLPPTPWMHHLPTLKLLPTTTEETQHLTTAISPFMLKLCAINT